MVGHVLAVTVDPHACVGTGDCARMAPAAFRLREDDLVAEVLVGAVETDPRLLSAALLACPMQAISVIERRQVAESRQ
jgi:ferredoxin